MIECNVCGDEIHFDNKYDINDENVENRDYHMMNGWDIIMKNVLYIVRIVVELITWRMS